MPSKTIIVFDHATGEMTQMPLEPGGFLVICEPPMKLDQRSDHADGTVELKMKLSEPLPPSPEGREFLSDRDKNE